VIAYSTYSGIFAEKQQLCHQSLLGPSAGQVLRPRLHTWPAGAGPAQSVENKREQPREVPRYEHYLLFFFSLQVYFLDQRGNYRVDDKPGFILHAVLNSNACIPKRWRHCCYCCVTQALQSSGEQEGWGRSEHALGYGLRKGLYVFKPQVLTASRATVHSSEGQRKCRKQIRSIKSQGKKISRENAKN